MNEERLLQISLASMISLGTLLLGMGQEGLARPLLPLLATVVAFTSVYVTDHRQWFQLPRMAANIVALFAVAAALVDMMRRPSGEKLIALANLLVYLQCVLLLHKKQNRTYWQLAVLSFLQVVVASALNLGLEYGLILGIYSPLSIATLLLFFVHRESGPFTNAALARAGIQGRVSLGTQAAARGEERGRPAAPRMGFDAASSTDDPAAVMLNRKLVVQGLLLVIGTLACSVTFFFFLPRFRDSGWKAQESDARWTGFANEVSLTEIGRLLESPQLVMRVWFFDAETDAPYGFYDEPYFRGAVLDRYQPIVGQWAPQRSSSRSSLFTRMQQPSPIGDMVRQRIMLQPQRSRTLFSIAPAYQVTQTPKEIVWDSRSHVLIRDEDFGDRFEYALDTSGFRDGRQVVSLPVPAKDVPGGRNRRVSLPVDEVKVLTDKVDEILQAAGLVSDDPYAWAKELESYFRTSGEYVYSLVSNHRTPHGVDPVVEFVRDRKTGHCEHFASALTLMLRAKGIPARMVLGYKGAEYNSLGGFYQVRELHTHAWVEAYFRNDQLPESVPRSPDSGIEGYWLRLDPTPGDEDATLAEGVSLMERVRDFRDYLQLLWNDYVLGLDSQRQWEAVYGPFLRNAKAFFSPESWSYFSRVMVVNMGQSSNWLSWRTGVLVLLIIAIYRLLHILVARLVTKVRERGRRRRIRRARRVDFYARLEASLRRHGIRRRRNQTQQEFSRFLAGRIDTLPSVCVVPRITDAFYRVRFGGEQLDRKELQELEQSLGRLEQDLRKRAT